MLESDYPHSDTSWPDTQQAVDDQVNILSPHEVALVTHLNASELYGHPLPTDRAWLPTSSAATDLSPAAS